MRKLLQLLASFCLLLVMATELAAQQSTADVPEYVKKRKFYQRTEWFNYQRAYPEKTVPVELYWRERERAIQQDLVLQKTARANAVTWQTIGPHGVNALPGHWGVTSGRVRGLAISPNNSDVVYIGAAAGGIWKTTNGGESWSSRGQNLETLTFGAIAIDPQNPETVYAGTGEARFASTTVSYDGKGLFKSTNGGQNWTEITTAFGAQTHFAALRVDPFNSNIVYAALASGYSYVGSLVNEGIWVSTDGGANWTQTLAADDAFEVLPHPTRDGDVYGGIGGGQNNLSGVWFSDDNGQTWTRRSDGLPSDTRIDRIHLAISPDAPSTIYAVIFESIGLTRVFKSTNSGNDWDQVATGLGGDFGDGPVDQGGYDLCIAVNPDNADEVYVGNVELHRTTNGRDFSVVRQGFGFFSAWDSPMHVDYHAIAYAPSNTQKIYVGNDGGIYRSADGGSNWNSLGNGINTLQFYRIASNPNDADMLIGGAQDNGIIGNKNVDAGEAQRWTNLSTGDGFECFFDPTNPDVVYASTQNVNLYKSTIGLDGFNFIGIPIAGRIINGIPDDERNLIFLAPFFMHPTNPQRLYTATNRVYRTTDGGDNWTAISGSANETGGGTIQTMAQSMTDAGNMILGAGSQVFVSTDGGFDWTDRSAGLPNRFVSRVVTHPHKDSTMFVVFSGFGNGQKVYRTPDRGVTWVNISGNLPNVPHSDLFIDPHIPDNLSMYVANDLGVYSTNDGGLFWQREGNGMPIVPAIDFDYHWGERILRVATHGRSVFQTGLPLVSMALTAPNGGENFAVGARYDIKWIGNGFSNPDNVRLEYSVDNGQTWSLIANSVPNDVVLGAGSYRWLVPNAVSDSARVRVIDPGNNQVTDPSNGVFKIFVDPQFAVVNASPFTNDKGTFTSVSWADYDSDEFLDAAVTSEHPTERQLRLYHNNRNGTFSNVTAAPIGTFPLQSSTTSWGDLDKDGDLDLAVATIQTPLTFFRNLGDGTFSDATTTVFGNPELVEMTSAAWIDYNRDNQLDLFVTTGGSAFAAGRRNILYSQIIPGALTSSFLEGNFDSRGCAWGDFNNDGYPDLFVANYGQNNLLYKVVQNGTNIDIVRVTTGAIVTDGGNSNAAAWGDYDNDGDLDLFVANDGTNFLYRNNGNETFARVNSGPGVGAGNSKGCSWGDYDNDGDLDLVVANDGVNFLYSNNGNATFTRVTLSIIGTTNESSNGCAWGDYDNDGNLDLMISNGVVGTSQTQNNMLLRNTGNANNWLNVKLHGVVSNTSGIGARLRIRYQVGTSTRRQMREISGQTGGGQNSMVAHFGLGSVTTIDSLIVQWSSRRTSVLTNVTANQQITVFEGEESNLFVKTAGGELAAASGFVASACGDYNNDGFDDLFLANLGGNNALYRNLGDPDGSGQAGNFAAVTASPVVAGDGQSTGGSWADYDNDGDLDLYVTNLAGVNFLYRNNGYPNFTFTQITTGAAATDNASSTACSWGDFDSDGDVDLFVANQGSNAQNFLYRNDGNGQFVRLTTGAVATQNGSATGCAWVDFDNDSDLDLFVTYSNHSDVLYRNLGAPNFDFNRVSTGEIVTDATGSKGCSWTDYDNDGDPDAYVIKTGMNRLYRNDGQGAFTRITTGDAVNDEADSRSSAWGEADNDGFLDLLVVNPNFNQMYAVSEENTIHRSFPNAVTLAPGSHFGASWSDLDNDGDMDLYVPNSAGPGALFRNNGGDRPWLEVKCIGTVSNKSAIGTRVRVKAKIVSKLDPIWQTREISAQSGTGSQNSLVLLFGLSEATQIDSLVVEWPRSSALVLTNLEVNQRLVLRENVDTDFTKQDNSAVAKEKAAATGGSWADVDQDDDQDLFVTTLKGANLLFINKGDGTFEKNANNALVEEAMPSTASTWADVDNNGTLDVFIANYDANSALFLNNGSGDFTAVDGGDLTIDHMKATACSWGDFDNDGWVDLFVATEKAPNLLYHNDGNATFSRMSDGDIVKPALDARACAWADFDNDGDLDLFVANFKEKNELYRNEGKGKFTRVEHPPFNVDVGASMGCSWGDYDNDGHLDLFVANQEEADFLYRNNGDGSFSKITSGPVVEGAGNSTGSSWVDFDNDADLDLFVSDFGGEKRLFRNLGGGFFEREKQHKIVGEKTNAQGHAWADIDNDGGLEVFVANNEQEQLLFHNEGNDNRWIKFELAGRQSNRAAIGARVRVKAIVCGYPVWQTREVSAQTGGGMSGQSSLLVEFGLGNASKVDSLIIHWPSGAVQIVAGLGSNETHRLEEENTTGVEQVDGVPHEYHLYANFPNPFNPSTVIRYQLLTNSEVSLIIYNMLGQRVKTLVQAKQPAGRYTVQWNGTDDAGEQVASGVYFYRLHAGDFVGTRRLLLIR